MSDESKVTVKISFVGEDKPRYITVDRSLSEFICDIAADKWIYINGLLINTDNIKCIEIFE